MDYIFRAKKFNTKKRLGQNFLVCRRTIERIVKEAEKFDEIVEIGAGAGFVTEKLVKNHKITAIELDEEAIEVLKKINSPNLKIIHQDILKFDFSSLENDKVAVVANIPYYITSPILVHLLGEIDEISHPNREKISEIILMVQLEVAKRLVAKPNSPDKAYGMLSILAQFFCDVEIIKEVSKKCFYPSPKVNSALVRLKINDKPRVETDDYKNLRRVIRACFMARRKNIKNSLLNAGFLKDNILSALKKLEIDVNTRGETLSIEDFARLSEVLK